MGLVFGDGIVLVERYRNKGGLSCAFCQRAIAADTEFAIQMSHIMGVCVLVAGHLDCFRENWQIGYDAAILGCPRHRSHHVN